MAGPPYCNGGLACLAGEVRALVAGLNNSLHPLDIVSLPRREGYTGMANREVGGDRMRRLILRLLYWLVDLLEEDPYGDHFDGT